jgi:hypothetical protein
MLQYALLALSAVKAISSVSEGYAQKKENEYNAGLLGYKAASIDVQKNIEYGQYERLKGTTWGTSMANVAKMGISPHGSALAVMLSAQKQIMIDQTIGQFNLEQEKRYTLAEADAQRRAGKRAVKKGYANAFSEILSGTYSFGTYAKGIK